MARLPPRSRTAKAADAALAASAAELYARARRAGDQRGQDAIGDAAVRELTKVRKKPPSTKAEVDAIKRKLRAGYWRNRRRGPSVRGRPKTNDLIRVDKAVDSLNAKDWPITAENILHVDEILVEEVWETLGRLGETPDWESIGWDVERCALPDTQPPLHRYGRIWSATKAIYDRDPGWWSKPLAGRVADVLARLARRALTGRRVQRCLDYAPPRFVDIEQANWVGVEDALRQYLTDPWRRAKLQTPENAHLLQLLDDWALYGSVNAVARAHHPLPGCLGPIQPAGLIAANLREAIRIVSGPDDDLRLPPFLEMEALAAYHDGAIRPANCLAILAIGMARSVRSAQTVLFGPRAKGRGGLAKAAAVGRRLLAALLGLVVQRTTRTRKGKTEAVAAVKSGFVTVNPSRESDKVLRAAARASTPRSRIEYIHAVFYGGVSLKGATTIPRPRPATPPACVGRVPTTAGQQPPRDPLDAPAASNQEKRL